MHFIPIPHPHQEARQAHGPILSQHRHFHRHPALAWHSWVSHANARIAASISAGLSTMWCAYAFLLLALIALPPVLQTGSVLAIVAWISQTLIQLTALSILAVQAAGQGRVADERAMSTYHDVSLLVHHIEEVQRHLGAQDTQLIALLQALVKEVSHDQPSP